MIEKQPETGVIEKQPETGVIEKQPETGVIEKQPETGVITWRTKFFQSTNRNCVAPSIASEEGVRITTLPAR